MAEPVLARRWLPTASRLDEACARMSRRLAGVVAALGDADGAAFLRTLPPPAGTPPPDGGCLGLPSGDVQAVDRLVAGLRLGVADRDLLVLAVVAHHHEGVAAVLRGLHPQGRPAPTVGLVAALAEAGGF